MTVVASASPSLALVKYWGKLPGGVNLPATSSLAVTLDGLRTTTRISRLSSPGPEARRTTTPDEVWIGGMLQPIEGFAPVIDLIRDHAASDTPVRVESENNFPTAAGIASSSSGFAALAIGLDAAFETRLTPGELSAAARIGSGSAARAVFGGFTVWPAGAERAEAILGPDHWPELRILIVLLHTGRKPISSRAAMRLTADTSPVYEKWCAESGELYSRGLDALRARDLEALGTTMRESYLFMFSTMFTTRPPVIYWLPESLAVIRTADTLRERGMPVWETMDAGPQVKLLTTVEHVEAVRAAVIATVPEAELLVSSPGGAPEVAHE